MPLTAKALKDTALLQLFTASVWRSQFKCQFLWAELPDHPRKGSEYLCLSTSSSQPLPFTLPYAPLQRGPYRSASPLSPCPQHRVWPRGGHEEWMYTQLQIQYGYLHLTWIFKIKLENPMMSSLAVPQTRTPHTPCETFTRLSAPCGTSGNSAWEVLD